MGRSPWIKHGFLNTLEHGITRGADALVALVLLWTLSPEVFAKLASSQALVAPLILFFIAPETVLYRDYLPWKKQGPSVVAVRLSALRRFAWGKLQFSFVLALVLSALSRHELLDRFWALIWAFALILGPQLSGPDREYLRMDLKLEALNALSLYQKLSMLLGTIIVVFLAPGRVDFLAGVALASIISTSGFASSKVKKLLRSEGATAESLQGKGGIGVLAVLKEALLDFSGWQHCNGVILGWIQTMDLFFLTVLALPGRETGLYAAVLKVANFSVLLPLALGNAFSVWVARRSIEEGRHQEARQLTQVTIALILAVGVQGWVIYWISPSLFEFLSHGRWNAPELALMHTWLPWILTGAGIFSVALPLSQWLAVREKISRLFYQVYVPWGGVSLASYFVAVKWGLPGLSHVGGAFQSAAAANVLVSGVFIVLLGFQLLDREARPR